MMFIDVPSNLCCPLTKFIYEDPVQVIHGNTYERCAIEEWLSITKTDPLNGERLFVTVLFSDNQMRKKCQSFLSTVSCAL